MHRTALHDYYLELVKNLWVDFVFYIPNSKLFKHALEKIDLFKENKLYNTVLVLDYHRGPIILRDNHDRSKTVLKNAVLEQNIFNLLQQKAKLEPYEFDYVSKKYLEQIETLAYITNWLNNNLGNYITSNNDTFGLFALQKNSYKAHHEVYLEHFCSKKPEPTEVNLNLENLINSHYKDLKQVISKENQSELYKVPKKVDSTTPTVPKNKDKPKKIPLISPEESENSILKAVFKIDH
ncbi:hypothetical protein [Flavisericum labens]|uniref:hypothetical protein n=1 Tax=Flavisericum labens TaxID=3377112 RepID=UPI00387B8A39